MLGVCGPGPRRGSHVLVSELHEVRSERTSWLIEFNGESWFQPYEFTAESPEDRDRILADAGFAGWLPDNDDSLDLADTLWPCRLRTRRHYLWRRVTGGFSSVKRP